jgi:hypothetical protein
MISRAAFGREDIDFLLAHSAVLRGGGSRRKFRWPKSRRSTPSWVKLRHRNEIP